MSYCGTTALEKITALGRRIRIIQGGTSAGKTISILISLINEAITQENILISVVSDTFPNLRRGAMRDFLNICDWTNVSQVAQWSKSNSVMEFPNGSKIEFFSTDMFGALGARRDILFINEANRITFDTFNQLEPRTRQYVILDFNPSNEFWAHTELLKNEAFSKVSDFLKLNYLDNESLERSIVDSIERRRGDGTNNWWRVYGLGEIGSLEGNVYEGWLPYTDLPKTAVLKRYGVDFGFSNDPTAVVAVYEDTDEAIYLKLEVLETKLLTPDLIAKLKKLPEGLFVCDNARPEIIAEMNANGLRAIGSDKTAGEKMNGKRYNIELVQRRKVYYRAEDKELEREYLTYAWRKKKTGEILDEPEDGNDHCMDAIAYAVRDMARKPIEYASVRI